MNLVAGRRCGECTACCKELTIDDPALKKPGNVLCTHCVPKRGCGIYESRPQMCRDWYCGWRYLNWLDESCRPDRSNVLIQFSEEDIPLPYRQVGLVFNVLTGVAAVKNRRMVDILGALIREDVPVFLSAKGPPGYGSTKVFLNTPLAGLARSRDGDAFRAALVKTYLHALAQPKQRMAFPAGSGSGKQRSGEQKNANCM
jgi:hypothetical protein